MDKARDTYMISTVGGGGKTTICQFLSNFFYKNNTKIIITTTTKIYKPNNNVFIGPIEDIPLKEGIIIAGSKLLRHENKLIGYDPDKLDFLCNKGIYDYIIVEADGAKRKPIKAPGEHEPVIPNNTNLLIGVIGLDSYNKVINEDNVFRADLFKKITINEGIRINTNHYKKLIENKNGLFKGCTPNMDKLVILNKSDICDINTLKHIIHQMNECQNHCKIIITSFKEY